MRRKKKKKRKRKRKKRKTGTSTMARGHGIDFKVSSSTLAIPISSISTRSSHPNHNYIIQILQVRNLCSLPLSLPRCLSEIMFVFINILCAVMVTVASSPTIYDQRQSGKTNVRVEVKDAVIIAVGDDEFGGDYDYSYDYSDLTIKPGQPSTSSKPSTVALVPPKPTTSKPVSTNSYTPSSTTTAITGSSSSSSNSNATQNSPLVLEAENNTIIFPSNKPGVNGSGEPLKIPLSNIHRPDQIPVVVIQETHPARPHKFLPVKTVEKQYTSSSLFRGKVPNGTVINPEELPLRHCSPGFFLDNHNRCKRIRRPVRGRRQLPIGLPHVGH